MLLSKRFIIGLSSLLLCCSLSDVEAGLLKSSIRQETGRGWENIFERSHEFKKSPERPKRSPKGKEKGVEKKKNEHKTSSQDAYTNPTRSPIVSQVENIESTDSEAPIIDFPTMYPVFFPTIKPSTVLSSSPTRPNLTSIPLLDFEISFSQSSASLNVSKLEESMETTLRLGMVNVDIKSIELSAILTQTDSSTYEFSRGSVIMNDDTSFDFLQTEQTDLLSDTSFIEAALQQEMKDPTIRIDSIQIMQQSETLPSAVMVGDEDDPTNGMLIILAVIVCLLTFCFTAALCYKRYRSIKR